MMLTERHERFLIFLLLTIYFSDVHLLSQFGLNSSFICCWRLFGNTTYGLAIGCLLIGNGLKTF